MAMDDLRQLIYYTRGPHARTFMRTEAIGEAGATAALPTQRMRAAFSPATSSPAVLQRPLSEGGAKVVKVEGTAAISGDEVRQGEAD
jgi:hypothetical protein